MKEGSFIEVIFIYQEYFWFSIKVSSEVNMEFRFLVKLKTRSLLFTAKPRKPFPCFIIYSQSFVLIYIRTFFYRIFLFFLGFGSDVSLSPVSSWLSSGDPVSYLVAHLSFLSISTCLLSLSLLPYSSLWTFPLVWLLEVLGVWIPPFTP